MLMSLFIKPRTRLIIPLFFIYFPFSGFANEFPSIKLNSENDSLSFSDFAEKPDNKPLVSPKLIITDTAVTSYESVLNNRLDLKDQYSLLPQDMIFDEKYGQKQVNDLGNINYASTIKMNDSEWHTKFEAENQYTQSEQDNFNLDVSTFYISYNNKTLGIKSAIGRQASPGGGISGPIDGFTLQSSLFSHMSLGISAGFPVNTDDKKIIQRDRPFVAFNANLPGFYKSLVLKPFIVMQQKNGFTNRQSIGSEATFSLKRSTFYHLTDYDLLSNEISHILFYGQFKQYSNTLYHITLDYQRNPALELDNTLVNEYRASNLKNLSNMLSDTEIIALASNQSENNYSVKLGNSFPINSRLQFGTDIVRLDQLYKIVNGDDQSNSEEHNYQNKLSTHLIASNMFQKHETLSMEVGYIDAKYYTNTKLMLRDKIKLSGLYQLDFAFHISQQENSDGEALTTTLPTARFTCHCSKKLFSELWVGYESWNFGGDTLQTDTSQLIANLNLRMQL